MQGKTHLVIGAAAGLAAAVSTTGDDWRTLAVGAALGGLSGLVPDWLQVNLPGASKQIKGAFGHRGFSHWLWTALLATWGARLLWEPAGWPVLAGWLSHVLLDALSNGVPMFWPLGRLTLAHVKTGGKIDSLVGGAGLVVLVALAVIVYRGIV